MKIVIKLLSSSCIIAMFLLINRFLDARGHETFSRVLEMGDGYIFVGLQLMQWMCTWSMPLLLISLTMIWLREIGRIIKTKLTK